MGKRLLFAAFGMSLSLAVMAAGSESARVALVGGTLIDGYGGEPIQDSVVLLARERISAVGNVVNLAVPAGYKVVSTAGMTVLPGLWDMHVHLMLAGHADYGHWFNTYSVERLEREVMPANAHQLLMAGVTSARDLGAPLQAILSVKRQIQAGVIPGPTLYVAGPFLQHRPYPGSESYRWGINGPADARRKVRTLIEAGVDQIKVVDQDEMSADELAAIVAEAHRAGKPVTMHAHRPDEIRRGLLAGTDSLEHIGLSTAPSYPDDIIAAIRERVARESDLGPLFWTPTVEGLLNYAYFKSNHLAAHDPRWVSYLPKEIADDVTRSLQHFDELPYYQLMPARQATLAKKMAQLTEAGVVLLVGTDSGVPGLFHGDGTWRELDAWVSQFAISPMDAIRGATYWPAVYMHVDADVGTVSPGKYADIVAVRGDVLRYIDLLQNIDMVFRHGRQVK